MMCKDSEGKWRGTSRMRAKETTTAHASCIHEVQSFAPSPLLWTMPIPPVFAHFSPMFHPASGTALWTGRFSLAPRSPTCLGARLPPTVGASAHSHALFEA
jgi:hypothetical protein